MTRLARLTLLAYPRAFRRSFGPDYLRTAADLRAHGRRSRLQIAGRLVGDAATVAPAMRWSTLRRPTRDLLLVTAGAGAVVGVALGSQGIAVLVVALGAAAALSSAGRDRPVAPTESSMTRRWYWWLVAAAGAFLIGLGVAAVTEDDGELPEAAWATWMLSWATAALLALVGVGLGTARLLSHRR